MFYSLDLIDKLQEEMPEYNFYVGKLPDKANSVLVKQVGGISPQIDVKREPSFQLYIVGEDYLKAGEMTRDIVNTMNSLSFTTDTLQYSGFYLKGDLIEIGYNDHGFYEVSANYRSYIYDKESGQECL